MLLTSKFLRCHWLPRQVWSNAYICAKEPRKGKNAQRDLYQGSKVCNCLCHRLQHLALTTRLYRCKNIYSSKINSHLETIWWRLPCGASMLELSTLAIYTTVRLVMLLFALLLDAYHERILKNNGNLSSTFQTKGHRHMPIYHSKPAYFFILKIVRLWPLADKPCLTGSSACCYYLNPNIPEARPFYSRYSLRRPDPICN